MSRYITKEAELNEAILRFATRCLGDGDLQMLAALGFKRRDVERLQELRLSDLRHLAGIKGHMLKPVIDRDCFYKVLAHIEHHRENEAIAQYLLKQEAPLDMMRALFGMSGGDYAHQRQMLGIQGGIGRTKEPSEAEELALWTAYQRLDKAAIETLTPRDWITLHEQAEVPLRNIWQLMNRWNRLGHPSEDAAEPLHIEDTMS